MLAHTDSLNVLRSIKTVIWSYNRSKVLHWTWTDRANTTQTVHPNGSPFFFSFIIVTKMWRHVLLWAHHAKTCCTLIIITTYTSHITGLATPTCTREEGKSCANKIDPTSDMSWTAVPARKPELEDKRALSPLSTKLSVKESQAQHGDWQASQEDNIMGFSYFSCKSLLSLSQNSASWLASRQQGVTHAVTHASHYLLYATQKIGGCYSVTTWSHQQAL